MSVWEVELDAIADLYDDLVSSKTTMQEVESSVELQALQMKLGIFTETLESKYPYCQTIYLIIRRCARTGAFPAAFCVPNSVALASPTLWGVQWAIH